MSRAHSSANGNLYSSNGYYHKSNTEGATSLSIINDGLKISPCRNCEFIDFDKNKEPCSQCSKIGMNLDLFTKNNYFEMVTISNEKEKLRVKNEIKKLINSKKLNHGIHKKPKDYIICVGEEEMSILEKMEEYKNKRFLGYLVKKVDENNYLDVSEEVKKK